jgi:hypothetical protein
MQGYSTESTEMSMSRATVKYTMLHSNHTMLFRCKKVQKVSIYFCGKIFKIYNEVQKEG